MLDNWEENLGIITANRTTDDELVITHLGDCMWKERSEVILCHFVLFNFFEDFIMTFKLLLWIR